MENQQNYELKFRCLEMASRLLNEYTAVVYTNKTGNALDKIGKFLNQTEANNWIVLNEAVRDRLELHNYSGQPKILDVIYFGNKLYQYCISEGSKLEDIIDEIKRFHDEQEEKDKKEKDELERLKKEIEEKDKEERIVQLEISKTKESISKDIIEKLISLLNSQ